MNAAEEVTNLFVDSGLSQEDFARKCKLHRSNITNIMNGTQPKVTTLEKILNAFGKKLAVIDK